MNLSEALTDKKLMTKELVPFGFEKRGYTYRYDHPVVNGQFRLEITVARGAKVSFRIFDNDSNEEYLLYSALSVKGALVGRVRKEVDAVLSRFVDKCFKTQVYAEKSTLGIIAYAHEKYGDVPEHLWERYPDYAVIRKSEGKKWYCVMCKIEKSKVGLEGSEKVEIANFKIDPKTLPELLKRKGFSLAYHMNKKSWVTVLLDGSVSLASLKRLLDTSYALA